MIDRSMLLGDVPFVPQRPNDFKCSEASASMVLKYHGFNVESNDIACENLETMSPCLNEWLSCSIVNNVGNIDTPLPSALIDVKNELDARRPVMARILPTFQDELHTIVIIGYDADGFFVNDPARGARLHASVDDFVSRWRFSNFRYVKCAKKKLSNLTESDHQGF